MDNPGVSVAPTVVREVYIFAGCAAMNSINLGFDIGVNTDVGPALLASDLIGCSEEKLELFMGSLNLWAIAGALAASLLADQLGRRKSFAVASVGFLVGVSCMATAQSFTQLMGGRVLVGLGVGFGFAVDPVYIAEISPPHARGRLVTWSEIGTNIGILVGWCAGYALSGLPPETSWRVMLGTGCVLPVVMLFLVAFVMPESPRWLIRMGRIDEAKSVLTRVNPPGADIDGVVRSIQDNIVIETRESGSVTWHQMFHPTPALRRMLVVGIGVAVCQQLVGIDAIQYFLLFILKQSGVTSTDDQFRYLIMIGVLKLGCIFVAGALFDTRGRRPLMFASCAGMATAMLILAAHMASLSGESVSDGEDTIAIPRACVSWHEGHDVCAITAGVKGDCIETCIDAPTPFCARYAGGTIGIPPPAASASDSDGNTGSSAAIPIFALCMYMMSFSLGMGPGAWLIPSEVFSNAVRAKAMSMATVANRLAATFMASSFLTIAKLLTYSGVLVFYVVMTMGVAAFMYKYLPETKGRSLEDMLRYFQDIAAAADSRGGPGDGGGGLLSERDSAMSLGVGADSPKPRPEQSDRP